MTTRAERIRAFRFAVLLARGAHDLSAAELAEGLDVSYESIGQWESGSNLGLRKILRAMWRAEPRFARIAHEIWRLST